MVVVRSGNPASPTGPTDNTRHAIGQLPA